jgi:hypothetical protein
MYKIDGSINVCIKSARDEFQRGNFKETNVYGDDLDSQGSYGTLLQSKFYFRLAL